TPYLLQFPPANLPLFPRPTAPLSYWYDHPPIPLYPNLNRILPSHHREGHFSSTPWKNVAIAKTLRMRESMTNR
ncbi:MAG: hypothetical protein ACK523_01620, partial [Pirellulaceae bacterium]